MYKLNDREVEIDGIEGEVSEGAYAMSATYVDTGAELTDAELDSFNDIYAAELYDDYYQNLVCAAEYAFEGDR